MKLDWRTGILYISALGMEGCVLYTIIALLTNETAGGRISVTGILLLLPLAFGINKLLQWLGLRVVYTRFLSLLAWLVCMLLTVKIQLFANLSMFDPAWIQSVPRAFTQLIYAFEPELLILIATGVIWWLGRRLSIVQTNFTTLVAEFQFSLIILLLTFFVASLLEAALAAPVTVTLVYFIFALPGISIAHALEGKSWLSGLYQGHWSGLLLVSIGLILILGLLVSVIITPQLIESILEVLKWLWSQIWKGVLHLISLLPEPGPAEPLPVTPPPSVDADAVVREAVKEFIPKAVREGLGIGWMILMIGGILAALWQISTQIFSWLRRRFAGMGGAEFESLPGGFRADLLAWLKSIIFKLLGLRLLLRRRATVEKQLPEVASVRQVYRQFLHWASSTGFPRHLSQTPDEYYYELVELLPESQEDLNLITQKYIMTRYGAWIPDEQELQQIKQSWNRIKHSHPQDRRQV